jgi:pyridoxamine 5'-phosphate oxidase
MLPDPFGQFAIWLNEALKRADIVEPNAMTLATVDAECRPSARMVLLRGLDERGLTFYTNYESRKAGELEQKSDAALVFYWGALHRQVRIEGSVTRIDSVESNAYFATRPRGHQLGAWASPQSRPVVDRAALDAALQAAEARFAGRDDVERPPHWGGYRLVPRGFEFWQGRLNRMHDRILYERDHNGTSEGNTWRISRLAP